MNWVVSCLSSFTLHSSSSSSVSHSRQPKLFSFSHYFTIICLFFSFHLSSFTPLHRPSTWCLSHFCSLLFSLNFNALVVYSVRFLFIYRFFTSILCAADFVLKAIKFSLLFHLSLPLFLPLKIFQNLWSTAYFMRSNKIQLKRKKKLFCILKKILFLLLRTWMNKKERLANKFPRKHKKWNIKKDKFWKPIKRKKKVHLLFY